MRLTDGDKLLEWLKLENPKQQSIKTCNFIISLVQMIESGRFDSDIKGTIRRIHTEWEGEREVPFHPNYPGYLGVVENRIAQIEEIAQHLGITIPGITEGDNSDE